MTKTIDYLPLGIYYQHSWKRTSNSNLMVNDL